MTSGAPLVVGVDLGTTYTCAAVADGSGRDAKVAQLSGTSNTIPSVVSITDDGVIAGEAAERRLVSHPSTTAREFKRRLGDATPIVLGSDAHSAEALSGHLLREVLDRIERNEGRAPTAVGLAHPASWGPFRLDLLRDAARHAGLDDVVLVPEPVAAAVANRSRVEPGSLVAVYDLGGGTFDAAVVRMGSTDDPSDVTVIGTPEGVERLGGIDFDQAVMAHVDSVLGGQVFGADRSDPETRGALMRLRAECQAAKEHLSQDSDVDIPVALPGLQTTVRMTRAEFETAVRPRLADSLAVFDRVVASAGSGWEEIDAVLLVGGSSNIPVVAQIVGEHTSRPVVTATSPHLAIAAGTATVAAAELQPAPSPAPATPAAVTSPTVGPPTSGGPRGSKLPLVIGVIVVAVLAIGAFVVLGSGSDDDADTDPSDAVVATDPVEQDSVDEDDAPEPEPEPGPDGDSDDGEAAPETTEAPAPTPTPSLVVEPCVDVPVDTLAVLATDNGAVLVDEASAGFVAGFGPADCGVSIDGAAELALDLGGAPTGGASFGPLFAISSDGGGVIGSTETANSRRCDLITGPIAITDGGAVFAIADAGAIERIRSASGNCDLQDDERLTGIAATAVGVAGSDQLAVAGTVEGALAVRVFTDSDTAVEVTADDLGADAVGIDAIVRCGGVWCAFDVAAQLVHLIGVDDAAPMGSVPFDGSLAGVTEIRSATPSSAGPALVTVEAGGAVAVVTVTD